MNLRVGIPLIQNAFNGRAGWVGGLYYIKNCLNALAALPAAQRPQVIVFIPADFTESLLLPEYTDNNTWLQLVKIPCDSNGQSLELQKYIDENPCDLLFPFNSIPTFQFKGPMIGWLPDFQHNHLPDFFTQQDIYDRELAAHFILEYSSRVVCSSHDVFQDIVRYYPKFQNKADIIHFCSILAKSALKQTPDVTLRKFGIHEKYIYLPNQFWIHKNHKMVFEAWQQLKADGNHYLLVCTGSTLDYRNPHYFTQLQTYLETHELQKSIRILGFIDREDQIQLYRGAAAILQPSLFEGWSTSLEDAKSLGKHLIVSDIPVHREQCCKNAYFFEKTNATALAALIKNTWSQLPDGFASDEEHQALTAYQADIQTFGTQLVSLFSTTLSANLSQDDKIRELVFRLSSELYNMQAYYTQNTNQIAQLKEKLESKQKIIDGHYKWFSIFLDKYRSFMHRFIRLLKRAGN
ncbi:MAG: glycosyltransferase family 4 protein [Gammaproteobacteria bacterium]